MISILSKARRRIGEVFSRTDYPRKIPRFDGRTIILGVHAGGLGDHLAYSLLPRLYKQAGASKVLLSRITNFGEPFARNAEIVDLVWKLNPYVDGFTDEAANVGETGWPPHAFFAASKRAKSPVSTVAEVHGFPEPDRHDDGRIPWLKPDLFYVPKARHDFSSKVVCDPHSISQVFASSSLTEFVHFVAYWHNVDSRNIILLCNQHNGGSRAELLSENERYTVASIFEYADIVGSAKFFLVTESGGQSIAAAVRHRDTFVLTTSRAFNERHFLWPTNTYLVTGQMTSGKDEWPVGTTALPSAF